ncbi:hypothetical protein FN846DRAFT_914307 [Sphaerosporella brunnea]|uniref:Uncharacterized protein n=1 Tax=Sphaerosporella brunnea TaxID=1250544 RepID=A0A5J5EDA4_9PEZI|nr:hypothetical protein FN846DRAFT_914307 [Sphaerosporella brunnea]
MAIMKAMIYKENKVPFYQRLYQLKDGKRLWMKTGYPENNSRAPLRNRFVGNPTGDDDGIHPRSPILLYPYMAVMGLGIATSLYGMTRMVIGKKY